jgi:predicted nucleic acid-binding protein
MIAYVDSSVLLRVALGQPNALPEWRDIDRGVSSALVTAESLRTLDRVRLRVNLSDIEVARRRATILALIGSLELVDIDGSVLDRAAQPMPTELGTLDAIHLASALLWREAFGTDLAMATHDKALVLAAQAHGLKTLGA